MTGYFKLRLRHAPRDYLQAQNLIPRESPQAQTKAWKKLISSSISVDFNIKPGEAGLKEDQPIALDDEEPKAGPSRNRFTERYRWRNQQGQGRRAKAWRKSKLRDGSQAGRSSGESSHIHALVGILDRPSSTSRP